MTTTQDPELLAKVLAAVDAADLGADASRGGPAPEDAAKEKTAEAKKRAKEAAKEKRPRSIQGAVAASDAVLVERVVADCLDGRYCWSPALGWMLWNGRVWERVDKATVYEDVRLYLADWVIREIARPTLGVGPDELMKTLTKGKIVALATLAQGQILVNGEDFDAEPDLITCENGVIDLREGTLLPHNPDLHLTRYIPTKYVPGAQHPDADAALNAMEPEVRDWMAVRLGQGVTGHVPDDDVMLLLHGDGQNGKSSLIDSLTLTLGGRTDHGAMTPIDDAVLAGDRDAKEERMALKGARLAFAEELPEGRRLNVTQLKKSVGTATMKARHLYSNEVLWVTSHTLILTTNYLPEVSETDHGTWRRLVKVPFPYTYVREPSAPHERQGDGQLKTRLEGAAQREAMLAWLVAGARRWYAAGRQMPDHPDAVKAATTSWREESDVVLRYWNDRLVPDLDAHVMSGDLKDDLTAYLKDAGKTPWSDKTIADRFGAHDTTKRAGVTKQNIRQRAGLSRPEVDDSAWGAARKPVPGRYHAWLGVRFRASDE